MARWMVEGSCDSGGNPAVERRVDPLLLVRDVFWSSVHSLSRPERLRLHFARAANQDLDARFGFFQLLAAGFAQLHAAFEQFQGALQRKLAAFHFLDDGFQLLESSLETSRARSRRSSAGSAVVFDMDLL